MTIECSVPWCCKITTKFFIRRMFIVNLFSLKDFPHTTLLKTAGLILYELLALKHFRNLFTLRPVSYDHLTHNRFSVLKILFITILNLNHDGDMVIIKNFVHGKGSIIFCILKLFKIVCFILLFYGLLVVLYH